MSTSDTFSTINGPGASATFADGVNDSGQVTGYYSDNTGTHGFLDSNGTIYTIDVPSASSTVADALNASDQVVGYYYNSTGVHGFLDSNGTISTINGPASSYTLPLGINASGQVVGYYTDSTGTHGFLDTNGTISTINAPGAADTLALGINDSGQVAGSYRDGAGTHGFLDSNGTISTINVPAASFTTALGINASGQIAGSYTESTGTYGFLDNDGTISTINEPSAFETFVKGINTFGKIVGYYVDSTSSYGTYGTYGFLDSNGTISTIDGPGAIETAANGINAFGQVVGYYRDSTGTHGFLDTPAQPSTIAGTAAGQATTDKKAIMPFSGVTITDPNSGSPTETVTVTPCTTANGALSDPKAATDGSTSSGGAIILQGSASVVTAALDGLAFTPAAHEVTPGQQVTTSFTITDVNSANLTSTDSTTSVVATALNDPPKLKGHTFTFSVCEGQTFTGLYADLLANAQDVNYGDHAQLTLQTIGQCGTSGMAFLDPTQALLTYLADGYDPAHPTDSFSYSVADPYEATVTGTVQVVLDAGQPTALDTRGNDTLATYGAGALVFAARGDDNITVNGAKSTAHGGPGANTVHLHGAQQSVVLQQGGTNDITGFNLHNGVLNLRQVVAEAHLTLGGDTSKLGTYFGVAASGTGGTLSFNPQGLASRSGAALAVLHGVRAITTLATLVNDGALKIS